MSRTGWLRPRSQAEAATWASDGATVVGGGAALMSHAFAPQIGDAAVDLDGIGLDMLRLPVIGAMVTIARLVESAELRACWPVVWEAAAATATPEVRDVATIGGTVAARLATSDLLTALYASRADVEVVDGRGTSRRCRVADYLEKEPVGVITAVLLGFPRGGAYRRFANRAGFAPAVAAVAGVRVGGTVEYWAGAVAERPFLLDVSALPAEELLRSDVHASAWYRRRLLAVLVDDITAALRNLDEDLGRS